MRTVIDGYNLMFAGGLLGMKRLGPDGLRKVRQRFLNDLSDLLGPIDAGRTTVVFDASQAPEAAPGRVTHKGLVVIFAVGDENADARIEAIVAGHSHPKGLTVVSSDRRVRQAATRRRAKSVTSDDYWAELDARRRGRRRPAEVAAEAADDVGGGQDVAEREHWLRVFGELDDAPELREALDPVPAMLTDEEVARIAREVDREFS